MNIREWHHKRWEGKEYREAWTEQAARQDLADLVVRHRVRAGMTQARLAELAGTTQARISDLEAGLGNPTIETLYKVCHGLGIALDIGAKPVADVQGFVELKVVDAHQARSEVVPLDFDTGEWQIVRSRVTA